MTSRVLGAELGGRDNALNFVRLTLASAVILGHTWPTGGFGTSRWEQVAGIAVAGFFVMSGYLIAASRMRLGWVPFLWHRFLRIMPAYWVCLLVVGFVLSPVAMTFGDTWRAGSATSYVTHNSLLHVTQWGVADTLLEVPYPRVWNGSLWTLEYEVTAYLAAAALLTVSSVRRRHTWTLPLIALLSCASLPLAAGPFGVTNSTALDALRLGSCFAVGMALWALRERTPVSAALAGVSTLVVGWLTIQESAWGAALAAIPLGYTLLWLGARLPIRIGVNNDLSYGMYIYAFPVQQTLAAAGASERLHFWGSAAAAFMLTLPLAWLSWRLVERPTLRLKHLGRSVQPHPPRAQAAV